MAMLDSTHQAFVVENHAVAVDNWQREATAPHVLMRPTLSRDGNMWCALYGDNLQDGVAGFGETPLEACSDFDTNWATERMAARARREREGR